jgi:dUTP pyrophosphatase
MKIKIIKFDNFVKAPVRAHWNDSGADVVATADIVLEPHKVTKVDLGLGLIIPDGYDACIYCKSGLSSKGIMASNAPIDSGYRGHINAILANITDEPYTFKKGEKVGQLVVRPVIHAEFVEDFDEEERGTGAFGSTGK